MQEDAAAGPVPADDSLDAIAGKLRAFRDARDWQRFHTPRNLALSIAVECGELLEHFQWLDDEDMPSGDKGHLADIGEELADVTIYVIQLADALGVPLSTAIAKKIDANERRYPVELTRGNVAKHSASPTHYSSPSIGG